MNDEKSQPMSPGEPRVSSRAAGPAGGTDALAARAHRVLRQIPGRRAPVTLAPRVLEEIARRAQLIWYRRPWTDWPESMRWLSSLVLAGVVAGSLQLIESGWTATKSTPAMSAVREVPSFVNAAETSARSLLSLSHALPVTWWIAGGFTLAIVGLGTLGLGTAAWRLAKSGNR